MVVQLAFSVDEVGELITHQLGHGDEEIASAIHRIAGGWPAAVTLAIEALKASPPDEWRTVFAGLDKPDAPLYSYLAEEVFARQPDAVRELVSKLAVFDRFTPELCEAVGLAGSRATLGELTRQGLFVEKEQDGSLALRPLIREYALESLPVTDSVARQLRVSAAAWLANSGATAEAMQVSAVGRHHGSPCETGRCRRHDVARRRAGRNRPARVPRNPLVIAHRGNRATRR